MTHKIRYSEKFISAQGEGRFVGVPSIFLRTFGCNFSCHGFGQPKDKSKQVSVEDMPYMTDPKADPNHPEAYKSIEELPVTPLGCDSSASWSNVYKHLAKTETVEEISNGILDMLPNRSFIGACGQDYHLVLTGGEPLLGWQRAWPALFEILKEHGLKNVTFETNGTQIIKENMIEWLNGPGKDIHVTWSVSPKLSISGENPLKACNPNSLLSKNKVNNSYLYTKFVVREKSCFDEVREFSKQYDDQNVKVDSIYCMPEGATLDQLSLTEKDVAEECISQGFRFSPRYHLNLWGNEWGR